MTSGNNPFYRRLLEAMPLGASIQTPDGRIVFTNAAMAKILAVPLSELLGQNLLQRLPLECARLLLEYLRAKDRPNHFETHGIFAGDNHEMRYGLVSVTPIQAPDGKMQGYFCVITDITDQKRTEAELRHMNEELDAFARTAAHDLQGPLAGIINYCNWLEMEIQNMSDAEILDNTTTIARTADKMSNIVDELLLLARMRREDVEPSPMDSMQLINDALMRLRYMVDQYSAQIFLPDSLPIALGYAAWVEEVWVNYISNAIKYGGQPPVVHIGGFVDGERVCFWVRDNGRGIAPQDRDRVFTEFVRLSEVRAKGHGLGLAIVRRIMEKLGGSVELLTEVGVGSEFRFYLPAAPQ